MADIYRFRIHTRKIIKSMVIKCFAKFKPTEKTFFYYLNLINTLKKKLQLRVGVGTTSYNLQPPSLKGSLESSRGVAARV